MTAVDPFTAATATYRNAMRHCGKTGEAFEVSAQRRSLNWPLVAAVVLAGIVWALVIGRGL